MKTITVFEHERLTVGTKNFTESQRSKLESFRGTCSTERFPFYSLIHRGIEFCQYVGILTIGDTTIEILPKVDRVTASSDESVFWRDKLIYMLCKVYKLRVHSPSSANAQIHSHAVLDIFLQKFLDEAQSLLHHGLTKCYHKVQDNCKSLKGKLLFSRHAILNATHQERFYVNYTIYDREHILNRILRETLKIIPNITDNHIIRNRAVSLLFQYPELEDLKVTEDIFSRIVYNRKTDEYRTAINLSKMLLLHYITEPVSGRNEVFALMFDMNKLWEEFVFECLKSGLKPDYTTKAQVVEKFWTSGSYSKTVRPDIVITSKDDKKYILDTKWKCPKENLPSDADLHQMFVYYKLFKSEQTAFVYPGSNDREAKDGKFYDDKICDMIFLPISSNNNDWDNIIKDWLSKLKTK